MIEGKSPALNQEIMVDELKKACISIMTEQHYDRFNAIETGSNGNLFAEVPTGSIAAEVYLDADDDGVRDAGESGISGVTVNLSGIDTLNRTAP